MHSVCCVFAFDISIKQIFKETFVDEEASTMSIFWDIILENILFHLSIGICMNDSHMHITLPPVVAVTSPVSGGQNYSAQEWRGGGGTGKKKSSVFHE